jgi:hypothetical protein
MHSKRLCADATLRKLCGMPRGKIAVPPAETVRRSASRTLSAGNATANWDNEIPGGCFNQRLIVSF